MKKILLLTTTDRPKEYTADIKLHLEKDLDVKVDLLNLEDLDFRVIRGKVQIFFNGIEIDDCQTAYIKHWHAKEELALVVNNYLASKHIKVTPSETARIVPKTKFGETFLMAINGLPVPDSVYWDDPADYTEKYAELSALLNVPFIFKAVDGKKGADNYLINDRDELVQALKISGNKPFIAQKFIENDGDYRIINFEDKVELVIHRTRSAGTHLNNTSKGGDGELVGTNLLKPQLLSDSIKAAMLLGRDISGIDVVVDPEGNHFILEVNYSPQLTTGTFLAEKRRALSDYFKNLI